MSKYMMGTSQAHKLLKEMCSTLLPWQTSLHNDLEGQVQTLNPLEFLHEQDIGRKRGPSPEAKPGLFLTLPAPDSVRPWEGPCLHGYRPLWPQCSGSFHSPVTATSGCFPRTQSSECVINSLVNPQESDPKERVVCGGGFRAILGKNGGFQVPEVWRGMCSEWTYSLSAAESLP